MKEVGKVPGRREKPGELPEGIKNICVTELLSFFISSEQRVGQDQRHLQERSWRS